MPIPKDILAVPRPKNSVVICYGKNKDRFAVRESVGCKRRNGNNVPINGKTIGHIVDGKYKFLYSFRDAGLAAKEEQDWLLRHPSSAPSPFIGH